MGQRHNGVGLYYLLVAGSVLIWRSGREKNLSGIPDTIRSRPQPKSVRALRTLQGNGAVGYCAVPRVILEFAATVSALSRWWLAISRLRKRFPERS